MGLGLKEPLLGQDPSRPQAIWERLYGSMEQLQMSKIIR
jgi:hypothetical protein